MSSQVRYRSGVVEYVALPTADDGTVTKSIEVGDLVYVAGGVAYPASYLSDQGNEAANQAAFAVAFAGVAVKKTGLQSGEVTFKLDDDPGYTMVATSGEFEFPSAATSWVPGDLVGADENADGDGLLDQQVAKVTLTGSSIGVAKVPYNALGTSQTTILVDIRSQLMKQEVQSGA